MGSVCTDHHHKQQLHPHSYLFSTPKKSHHSHLHDLNIPPRKLLSRRSPPHSPSTPTASDLFADHHFPLSPSSSSKHTTPDSTSLLMRKFLPFNRAATAELDLDLDDSISGTTTNNTNNNSCYDPDSDPYSSDDFRMYEFKVRRCTRSRSHDWTDCPFAHPGEKARRRDPRRHHYSSEVCPEYRRSGGHCSRGDECEFAHGVFEVWLHPARYRTEACKDGKGCKRKVCFFAHSPRELRVLPAAAASIRDGDGQIMSSNDETQFMGGGGNLVSLGDLLMKSGGSNNCCRYNYSPRSTLQQVGGGGGGGSSYCMSCCGGGGMGMPNNHHSSSCSPPMSPPSPTTNSPIKGRFGTPRGGLMMSMGGGGGSPAAAGSFSPLSRTAPDRFACMDHIQMNGEDDNSYLMRGLSSKEIALGQLMNSLEAMSFNEAIISSMPEESLMRGGNVNGMNIVNEQSNNKQGGNGLWVDVFCPSSPEEYGDRYLSSSPYGIRNLFSPAGDYGGGGGGFDSSYESSPNSFGGGSFGAGAQGTKVGVSSSSRFSKDINEVSTTTTAVAATSGTTTTTAAAGAGGLGDPDLGWVDDLLM